MKQVRRAWWMCLLWVVVCPDAFGLDRDRAITQFHHTAWTARDGAPSQVSALAQTDDGFLWIGSAVGLFRFDGVTFEQFQSPDGKPLPSQNIYSLMSTPDNGLWISFRPSGIGFLKDGKLRIFSGPEELPTAPVFCLARTPDGRIWAGTNEGLVLFNGTGWDVVGSAWNVPANNVRTMFTDSGGTLWVSQDESLLFLAPGSPSFQIFEKQARYAVQIAETKEGRLWAAQQGFRISPIKRSDQGATAENPVLAMGSFGLLFDRDGCLWTASGTTVNRVRFPERLRSGEFREDDGRTIETFGKSDGLSDTSAKNIFEDREGNIWVGTITGLDRFRNSAIVAVVLPDVNKLLTLVANDRNEIWAGSSLVGSFLRIGNEQIEKVFLEPKMIRISSMYRDSDDSYWWGANGGVWHQQNRQFKFFPQPKNVRKEWMWEVFRADDDGGLWVNFGDSGLVYFRNGVWERRRPPDGLPARGPSASFADDQKRIWLGYTENRVFSLDGEKVTGYTSADGIEIGRIKVIRRRSANLWCGGETGAAILIGNRFHTVKTEGQPFGAVSGIILTENGDAWLNEAHGIVHIEAAEILRLNEDPEYAVKYRLYDYLDNLPGGSQMNFTVSTAVETTDKRLWFATDNGLAMIDPAKSKKNTIPPPVVIRSVQAAGTQYSPSSNVVLPAGTTDLQISYAGLSLSIPERVLFKYRLTGYENQWHDADSRRVAYYTNLGPGKYHFQVIAANNDDVWNENGATLEFEVLPTFYQTNWFVLLLIAAFTVLGWVVYRFRVHELQTRMRIQFDERLSERTRIARDLHDTLLQGVVSAAMQLDVATERAGDESPARPLLDHVNGLMANVIAEGRNSLKGLRSQTVDYMSDLEPRLFELRHELDIGEQVDFRTVVTGQPQPLLAPVGIELHQICREALTNAFRHSGATVIEVEIEYGMRQLRIVVRDNGRGIDPHTVSAGRDGHFGLSGMRERAINIGGRLKIFSRDEGGTEVELFVSNRIAFVTHSSNVLSRWFSARGSRKKK